MASSDDVAPEIGAAIGMYALSTANPLVGVVMLGLSAIRGSKEKEHQKKHQEYYAEVERQWIEKRADIQLSQQLAVSRENLMSYMRTATDRSLSEVLRDYEFAEPQPTVYRLGPAKEPTFVEKVNAFIEQIVTTLRV